ncbi:MAG: hypothetical protein ACOC6P_01670 [Candidatus Aminicenantaceae bacterium]
MKEVNEKIKAMIKANKLIQVVIIDSEGMVVNSVGQMFDDEILASIFFPSEGIIDKIQKDLDVEGVEELSFKTKGKDVRIVMRYFPVRKMRFFLVAIFPLNSFYRQAMIEIIGLFYDMIDVPQSEIPKELMDFEKGEIETGVERPISEIRSEKSTVQYDREKEGLTAEIKGVVDKISDEIKSAELVIGDKPASEISDEAINAISHKLVKQLSSNVVEKMIRKTILQIADNLIKREMSDIKKELDSMISS